MPSEAVPISDDVPRAPGWLLAVLPLGVFLFAWLWVDPSLRFEATPGFPGFVRSAEFAGRFLTVVSGPVDYLAAWLAQFSYWPWAGALVVTALAAALALATNRLLRVLTGRPHHWLALLPVTALLAVQGQLYLHGSDMIAVAVSVAAASWYASSAPTARGLRVAMFLGLSLPLYYALGGGYLLFVVLCGIIEMTRGAGRMAGLLYLLSGEVVPQVVGVYGLHLSLSEAFGRNTPTDSAMFARGAFTLALLWIVLIVTTYRLTHPRPEATPARTGLLRRLWRERPAFRRAGIVLCLVGPLFLAYLGPTRTYLRLNQAVARGQYERAVNVAAHAAARQYSTEFLHLTNYALFRLGRLPAEMFHYRQSPEGLALGMVCGPRLSPSALRRVRYDRPFECSELYLQLGLVNQAERVASEALETFGPHARTLSLLARVNEVKGRPAAARHFLTLLTATLPRAGWARGELARLGDGGAEAAPDPELADLRARQMTGHTDEVDIDLEPQCLALLRGPRPNRMAFEYLLAYYLLNRTLDKFEAQLGQLDRFGFTDLPRHWAEALVVNEARTGRPCSLSGYRVPAELYQQFARFSSIIAPLQQEGKVAAARQATAAEFGNTYFFYYVFGESGVGSR